MTQLPLPSWPDLLTALCTATPPTSRLSGRWVNSGDEARWFSRSAWSLVVVARWRQSVSPTPRVTVWVPAYFCNESLALLRAEGVQLVFYPVDEHNRPAMTRLPPITQENRPDLFLLVHYFGEPSPATETVAFCRDHGAWLVEDAAHVLFPIAGVGEAGDCVLYSPHKHLAIPDGAVLVIRKDGPAGLAGRSDLCNALDSVVANTLGARTPGAVRAGLWVAKRVLQKLGVRARRTPQRFFVDLSTLPPAHESPAMSGLAARLLRLELDRLSSIAAHRSILATAWEQTLRSALPAGNLTLLPMQHTPYLACIAADDQAAAERLYSGLQSIGVPVATWPDLPGEVVASEHAHASAIRLRHTRLYLPVHQSMNVEQISSAVRKLSASIRNRWQAQRIESHEQWERLWIGCKRKSMPQTWEYGSAKATAERWRVLRYVVLDAEGIPTALFQVLVKGLPWLGGIARVNRGPLMLRDEPGGHHSLALHAIEALVREARRNLWWMMQIAPFLPPGEEIEKALRRLRFRKQRNYPSDSALVPLEGAEDELLMRLNRKWRNCLRKGQKLGVRVHLDEGGTRHFVYLMEFYRAQQRAKGFVGTPEAMLRALSSNQSDLYGFNLFLATDGEELIHRSVTGVLLTIRFGDFTEYVVGAVNDRGRTQQANSVLLWEALMHARRSGCRWFDVGGLTEDTPQGIADFKRGLNPEPYALVGEWRRWL